MLFATFCIQARPGKPCESWYVQIRLEVRRLAGIWFLKLSQKSETYSHRNLIIWKKCSKRVGPAQIESDILDHYPAVPQIQHLISFDYYKRANAHLSFLLFLFLHSPKKLQVRMFALAAAQYSQLKQCKLILGQMGRCQLLRAITKWQYTQTHRHHFTKW